MKTKKIVASIEARMGSSRLPGKVLMDIHGVPALERLVIRLKKSTMIDDIIIATTSNSEDDSIFEWTKSCNIECYRGDEMNVLQRVTQAHEKMESDIIVEITGDCPLLDASIIDEGIGIFLENDYDVVSNTFYGSYAQGIDVQVFSLSSLQWVNNNIKDKAAQEHVSLYFYENTDSYKIFHMKAPDKLYAPELRLQLDYQEDLDLIRKIYQYLEPEKGDCFSYSDVIELLEKHPELLKINSHCQEKPTRGSV